MGFHVEDSYDLRAPSVRDIEIKSKKAWRPSWSTSGKSMTTSTGSSIASLTTNPAALISYGQSWTTLFRALSFHQHI